MKIAYDAKRFFHNASGLGNYSRDLIRILAQFYPQNDLLLFDKEKSERGQEILRFPNVSFLQSKGGKLARQLNLGKQAQLENADIFHGLSGELPLKWGKTPIIKIVTVHDLIFERYPKYYSWFDRKIHFWKFKKSTAAADLIVAISEQTKKDILHFLKVPESKIRVVYQGCHQSFKEDIPDNSLSEVREKYSLPERFVLSVGTVEERKNLLRVVQAMKDTGIPLVVVGKKQKSYSNKIQQFAEKNKIDMHHLQGISMSELAALYRLADFSVYVSLFEGFGIPIIESLFCKTAVIAANSSSLPEAGGPGAVYVDPNNVLDIRTKILHLWNNTSERSRRAELGYQYVLGKFTDEKIAADMMEVYCETHG